MCIPNLYQTAHQVTGFILDSFGIVYQPNSMVNLLPRLGFVYKKTTLVAAKANLSAQAASIDAFRQN
jgi:transposase